MRSNPIYVPILKWKRGEREALKHLSDSQKESITPIIELTDYVEPEMIIDELKDCFPYPIYLDTIIADEEDRNYLISIIEEGQKNSLEIYPVCYIDDFADLTSKLCEHTNKLSVKIPVPEDIDGLSYRDTFSMLNEFKKQHSILLDIVLDLDFVSEKNIANRQYRDTKEVINNYLSGNELCNLIIISITSFPENLSSIPAGSKIGYSRFDFKIYKKLLENFDATDVTNRLIYSDYGVTKFTDSEIDFSKLRYGVLPKIRYTLDDSYLVLKGEKESKTRKLTKSYVDLAREIIESDYYYGENFSYGDMEIKERALGLNKKGPGSNTNWVTISANHHIAVVIEQLSKLFLI